MKKVIDGKCYNTETAEELAYWSNGLGPTDWHYCSETLHRTGKGSYFLFGEGGGLTKYAERYGSMRGPGSTIVPLSESEARKWVEEHDFDGDTYMRIFGEVEEA